MFYTTLADLHYVDRVLFLISAWLIRALSCQYHLTRGNRKRVHAAVAFWTLCFLFGTVTRTGIALFHLSQRARGMWVGGIPNYRVSHGKVGWRILNN